jgi:hypothetical protein
MQAQLTKKTWGPAGLPAPSGFAFFSPVKNSSKKIATSSFAYYGWIGQQSGSGFSDRPRGVLGVFASLDRL